MGIRFKRLTAASCALVAAANMLTPASAATAIVLTGQATLPTFPCSGSGSLLAPDSACSGTFAGTELASVNGDGAYCPPLSVNGTAGYVPGVTAGSTPTPQAVTMTVTANCTSVGDEAGAYTLFLSGTDLEDCAGAVLGSGTVTGNGPEGALSGTVTFYRAGIHYYITGNYLSAGENHQLHLWLDQSAETPTPCLFYTQATLTGHGAMADLTGEGLSSIDGATISAYYEPCEPVAGSARGALKSGATTVGYYTWLRVGLTAFVAIHPTTHGDSFDLSPDTSSGGGVALAAFVPISTGNCVTGSAGLQATVAAVGAIF